MSVRIGEFWRVRQARKARINQQLAEADALIPSQLDRWDRPTVAPDRLDMLAEPGEWEERA